MFKTALRSTLASSGSRTALRTTRGLVGKRFASTAPVGKRSWKSGAARWLVAGAAVYWYNTSEVFAETPEAAIERTNESLHRIQESSQPTIDAIVQEKRERAAQRVAEEEKRQRAAESTVAVAEDGEPVPEGEAGMGDLEEEAGQEGAFNPETGEINWDCPCLGGMAHGPCGPEFREAFSCFVYSKEEPKGVECIDKFKGMQDCFRLHPEMYGSELEDDEDEVEEEIRAQQSAKDGDAPTATATPKQSTEAEPKPATEATSQPAETKKPAEESHRDSSATSSESAQKGGDEGGELLPKAAHDATSK
ncbi:hypothetical protein EG329_003188 [Mollisiaceae sp. DMI_Dod_QoI]|nr:hypothetical protein EG329_003188 [Helotiales sp. DMI_Dod_QoI]